MKDYVRWYDQDKYLSSFMTILERLPLEVQSEIAMDIILNIPGIIKGNYDDFVNVMAEQNPQTYKRWYDQTPTLHAAIEAIKELTQEQREALIYSISDIVLAHSDAALNNIAQLQEIIRSQDLDK